MLGFEPPDGTDPADRLHREGLTAYRAGRYDRAQTALAGGLALRPADPEIALYLGSAQLLGGDLEAGIGTLEAALEAFDSAPHGEDSPQLADELRWQLANAHLARGERDPAVHRLKAVAAGTGFRQIEARELLDAISEERTD